MSQIAELGHRAVNSAKLCGHDLGPWQPLKAIRMKTIRASAVCKVCDMQALIIRYPLPTEQSISGEAVTLKCRSVA